MPALPPAPGRLPAVGRAAGNAWSYWLGSGVEPHVPTPSEIVHEAPHATLRRYLPAPVDPEPAGAPILLVPPLAVSITCFDLRPDQSLAAFLVSLGRPVYVVDFGEITYADRRMGFEDWIDGIVPEAITRVSAWHGPADVDVITWSLGGTLSLLTAASHPDLPLRAVAAIATPIDYARIPYLTPLRALGRVTGGRVLSSTFRAVGGLPSWAVKASFRTTALQRELTKQWFVLRNLADTETLARSEAVDRFIGTMPGYPGRFYTRLYDRVVQQNELASGHLTLRERTVSLADVRQHVLIVAGRDDAIAPRPSVERALDVLTGARSLRFEVAPGSHLGVLAGASARESTWRFVQEFLDEVAGDARSPGVPTPSG